MTQAKKNTQILIKSEVHKKLKLRAVQLGLTISQTIDLLLKK